MRRFVHAFRSCGLGPGLLAAALAVGVTGSFAETTSARPRTKQSATQMSDDVRRMLHWVKRTRDHGDAPFIVIDKRQTHLWLSNADGNLTGQAPVLLGLARGASSVPDIGEREMADIKLYERTPPAGRFVDSIALHLKLNERLAATQQESNRMIGIEDLDEQDLREVAEFYVRLAARAKEGGRCKEARSIDEVGLPADHPAQGSNSSPPGAAT